MAYSLSPCCRFISLKVPMHPRSLFSLPIFQVTNSGLKNNNRMQEKTGVWTIWHSVLPLGSGGGETILGEISSRRGNKIFEKAGGTTSGGGIQISKSPGGGIEQKSKIDP